MKKTSKYHDIKFTPNWGAGYLSLLASAIVDKISLYVLLIARQSRVKQTKLRLTVEMTGQREKKRNKERIQLTVQEHKINWRMAYLLAG